ncbi:MAG: HEAT repeat domain-containing protein [Anaerolineae bacterium]|nr:HEAT repeat domain-containing protein [Anaerolineae bacterium]
MTQQPPDIEQLKANQDITGLVSALGVRQQDKDSLEGYCKTIAVALCELDTTQAIEQIIQAAATAYRNQGFLGTANQYMETLVHIGAPAVEPLCNNLCAQHSRLPNHLTLRTLERLGDPRAIDPILTAWAQKHLGIVEAAKTLGKLGDPRAVPLIAQQLWIIPYLAPRSEVTDALDTLGWQPGTVEEQVWYWMAKGNYDKVVELGEIAVEPLLGAIIRNEQLYPRDNVSILSGGNDHTLSNHYDTLSKLGASVVKLIIKSHLRHKAPSLRVRALEVLGNVGTPRAIMALISTALFDNHIGVRNTAKTHLRMLRR